MQFIEYGKRDDPVVLLIHGMGCTGERSFSSTVPHLKNQYRIVIVYLDGYDEPANTFTTIDDQAQKLADYLKKQYASRLNTVLGMSMGGFIALALLTKCGIQAEHLILDSGYMPPWSKRNARLMSNIVAAGFAKMIAGKAGAVLRAGMGYIMGYCFRSADLCSFASKATIQNSEYSCLTFTLPNLEPLNQLHTEYWYGQKEKYMIRGMKLLKTRLPNMQAICRGNYGHGEIMMEQPETYGRLVAEAITKSLPQKQ